MHACVVLRCFLFTSWIYVVTGQNDDRALYPAVANVARRATVTANATCGEVRPEYYCRLIQGEFLNPWESQYCFSCDARSPHSHKKHPIKNVIDGGEAFWQSPSLAHGMQYDYVTITLDLKQVFQVSYVNIESALSPRPGNWILEKSLDGSTFVPWQYFAISDADCWLNYGTPPMIGRPKHLRDNQVICTSYFSRIDPLQNGTVFVSLIRGRASAFNPSQTLLNFISARYVRLRFQKLQKLNNDEIILMMNRPDDVDGAILRRYFYTVKEISVGAQCECNGHANRCTEDAVTGEPLCECEHNTCGATCDMCCPKYNQQPWQPATSHMEFVCEECNCNGHSVECVYNETVASERLSYDMTKMTRGGGVCLNCRDNTEGINCERCRAGFYRPLGSSLSSPCRRCQCRQTGSTGSCVPDDSQIQDGRHPGDCICQEEYSGTRCDRCAAGYRDYPWCERCPCNPAGSQNTDICAECLCKANVEGRHCDQCLPGHYHLSADNPDGCSPCFCFGVSAQCESLSWGKAMVNDMSDWQVQVDVLANHHGYMPTEDGDWLVYRGPGMTGQEEDPLYWVAPSGYLGDKLYAYGGMLEYEIHYETAGYSADTHHMSHADVILQGEEITIGKRGIYYRENQDNTVTVRMMEQDWYKRDDATGYFYQPITKADFMVVLSNLKGLLIRASYHTGQTASKLKDVTLEVAMETAEASDEPMGSVEKCSCPPGYTGMSCEKCEAGYRRVNNTLMRGECHRCDCHGHASGCDSVTGKCQNCEDNTAGDHCEKCRGGFFGDPTIGDGDWCKPCACPLVESSNNFAMDCFIKEDNSDYVCIGCQAGHVGLHCELCDDGFFGNPLVPGNYCQPCQCNNNIDLQAVGNCDPLTGECLKCLSNTQGFSCDQCKPGFYGRAENRGCTACNCDLTGSVDGQCDRTNGQCVCKPHYTGQFCDHCEAGFGNIEAGCLPCNCSSSGSHHQECDPRTGQCECQVGVAGLSCDTCQEGYFGLSNAGCLECDCDRIGSNNSQLCDPASGQCPCLPGVSGQRCEECQKGYWNLSADAGCESCDCDQQGSWDSSCHPITGQCSCKDGVGGQQCSTCQLGYYGFSYKGCRACQPCKSVYHVCDPQSGRCVCPPNTQGGQCQICAPNTWGHDSVKGCTSCGCHKSGSVNGQCDLSTGQCACKQDYTGQKCDQCQFGFYGFPNCRPCLCNRNGTSPLGCDGEGTCPCDETGACLCKANVEGNQCDRCKAGYFSLQAEDTDGCSQCYCFGKTDLCAEAPYFWNKVYGEDRRVSLTGRSPQTVTQTQGINVIPPGVTDVRVPPGQILSPLYWALPSNLTGDKTLSYRGGLEYRLLYNTPVADVDGSADWDEDTGTFSGTVAMLRSRGMVLEHRRDLQLLPNVENPVHVGLSEENWVVLSDPSMPVTKPLLLAVLSNLDEGYILAAPTAYNYYVQLNKISLTVASEDNSTGLSARGVELCQCPVMYSGASCQLPGAGFYRDPSRDSIDWSNLSNITMGMTPCQCNYHSKQCDPYTGDCQGCLHRTTGRHCEKCIPGTYNNLNAGDPASFCQGCACPLHISSNNFSPTCRQHGNDDYMCTECSEGTTGLHCERCLPGFYGAPYIEGERCKPCACNIDGAVSRSCDPESGQCQCRHGLSGRSCDQCRPRHALIGGRCKPCDDGCEGKLMAELDLLDVSLTEVMSVNLTELPPPFLRAEHILNITRQLQDKLATADTVELSPLIDLIKEAEDNVTALVAWANEATQEGSGLTNNSVVLTEKASDTETVITELLEELQGDVDSLEGLVEKLLLNASGLNISAALPQARDLLLQIQNKSFKKFDKAVNRELGSAKATLVRVNELDKSEFNISALEASLELLRNQLADLQTLLNKSAEGRLAADGLNLSNGRIYNRTEILHTYLEGNLTDLNSMAVDGKFYINEGEKIVAEAVEDLEMSERKLDILRTASGELDVRGAVISTGLERSQELVNQSWEHAYRLLERAYELNRTFSGSRAEAVDPLEAATVYKNIVLAVTEAREAARQAVGEANHTLSMARNKTLHRQVDESVTRSGDLAQRETEVIRGISDLQDHLGNVSEGLTPVERHLNLSDEELTLILGHRGKLGQGFPERVEDLDRRLLAVIQASNLTRGRATAKGDQVVKDLIPILLSVDPKTVLDQLGYNINQTADTSHDHLLKIENLTNWLNTRLDNINKLKSNLSSKILHLKDKIKLARAEANNVKASLSAGGNCVRSYRVPDHAGTTNYVSFNFKTNNTQENMLLFLLQNSPTEYLAVELNRGKVQFSWNVGGGPGRVIHPEPIERTVGESALAERWYRVEVKRIGRLALLTVKPLFGLAVLSEDVELSGTSPHGFSLLTFGNSSHLYVAGVPADYQPPAGVSSQNFTGCIGDVFLDNQRIGLFNFRQSSEYCSACLQPPSLKRPPSGVYQFDGAGYAALPGFQPYSSTRYVILLEFKTVWDNALLFLSSNPDSGDYLSLELRDGRLIFQFYLGGNSLGILTTKKQYNINDWVSVTAGRQNLRGSLEVSVQSDRVNSEMIEGLALPGNNGLELMDRELYFGGIPDSLHLPRAPYISRKRRHLFKRQTVGQPGAIDVETTPFRGCMRNVQIGSRQIAPLDLLEGNNVGVTEGCRSVGERLVGFLGDGFVELTGYSLNKGAADVSLTFRSLYPEGVLLLATGQHQEHFYSMALVNGLLQARISAGSGVVVLTAEKNYTDGRPHSVALLKYDRDVELQVDDALVGEGQLPVGSGEIRVSMDSGLYIGGLPSGVDTRGMVGTSKGMHGCISDIVINRGLLLLDDPVSYKLADIGRCSAAAMTSIFAPTAVTRRPSIWPGLGTSHIGPPSGFTRLPTISGTDKVTDGYKDMTTARGGFAAVTDGTLPEREKTKITTKQYPWLPSPVTTTTSPTRTSSSTEFTATVWPPWLATQPPSVRPKEDGWSSVRPEEEGRSSVRPKEDGWQGVFVTSVRHTGTGRPTTTTTSVDQTAKTTPDSGIILLPEGATTTQIDVHQTATTGKVISDGVTDLSGTPSAKPSTLSKFPVPETTSSRFPVIFVTESSSPRYTTEEESTTAQDSVSPVIIPGKPTTHSTVDNRYTTTTTTPRASPKVTRLPTEEITSGEFPTFSGDDVNDTIVILPGIDGPRETTAHPPDTSVLVEVPISKSSTEPTLLVPQTAPPQQAGTSGTTEKEPVVDEASVKPELESTVVEVTPTRQLTTPTILTATISVTPAATADVSPSTAMIEPTATTRFVVLPTAVQPSSASHSPVTTGTVPSVTVVGVPAVTKSSAPKTTTTPVPTTTTTYVPTSPPTSCAEGDEYGVEAEGISFGNTRYSYAEIKVRRKAVRKDFNITFDFRSFSPDGMFFYLTNGQQSHFVAGQLKGGKVVLTYNDRRGSPLRILTSKTFSDGAWHSVHIEKGLREISLEVDKAPVLRGGIPRRLNVTAPMYVGGLPRGYRLKQGLVSHSIRGCLRRFVMNGGLFQLKNASVVSGVGQCYSKVENGAYFNGDSYGVFDPRFSIGRAILIILTFRTHKTDGVLLTVSSYEGAPALTLELHRGALKFSMRSDLGVFTAESQYETDFALCDQRWHVVKAEVIQRVITLRVDGGNVSYAFDRSANPPTPSKHPLFIGGFPAYALPQAASYSQSNFEGCMKNVFINGIPVDWHNLVQSVEINKVSCPLL